MPTVKATNASAARDWVSPRSSVTRNVAHSPGTMSSGTASALARPSTATTTQGRRGPAAAASRRSEGGSSLGSSPGLTNTRATASATASRSRWTDTSKPAATIAEATSAPPTVPRL